MFIRRLPAGGKNISRLKYDVNHDRKSYSWLSSLSLHMYSWRYCRWGGMNESECIKMALFSLSYASRVGELPWSRADDDMRKQTTMKQRGTKYIVNAIKDGLILWKNFSLKLMFGKRPFKHLFAPFLFPCAFPLTFSFFLSLPVKYFSCRQRLFSLKV